MPNGVDDDKRQYFYLDVWKIPGEIMALPEDEKYNIIKENYVQERTGPFPDDYFKDKDCPIEWYEDLVVQLWFLFTMGGAVFCMPIFILLLMVYGLEYSIPFAIFLAFLSFHPLPDVKDYMPRCYLSQCIYKYFSLRILWTADGKDGSGGADVPIYGENLYIAGPHGVGAIGNFVAIPAISLVSGLGIKKGRILGCAADIVARTPFLRYMTMFGLCSANKKTIIQQLNGGNCLGLNPDGIAGMFQQYNEQTEPMYVLKRKGISRMILENEIQAIPCHIMGNSTVLTAVFDRYGIIKSVSRRIRASLIFFYGRWGLPIPHRIPIQVCMGSPLPKPKREGTHIPIKQADVEVYHERLMDGMKDVFDSHKGAYGWRKKNIEFL